MMLEDIFFVKLALFLTMKYSWNLSNRFGELRDLTIQAVLGIRALRGFRLDRDCILL